MLEKLHRSDEKPYDWAVETLKSHEHKELPTNPEDWVYYALLYQAAGDYDKGLDALLMAVETGYRGSGYLKISPLFKDLRSAVRFDEILNRIMHAVEQELNSVYAEGLLRRSVAQR